MTHSINNSSNQRQKQMKRSSSKEQKIMQTMKAYLP